MSDTNAHTAAGVESIRAAMRSYGDSLAEDILGGVESAADIALSEAELDKALKEALMEAQQAIFISLKMELNIPNLNGLAAQLAAGAVVAAAERAAAELVNAESVNDEDA